MIKIRHIANHDVQDLRIIITDGRRRLRSSVQKRQKSNEFTENNQDFLRTDKLEAITYGKSMWLFGLSTLVVLVYSVNYDDDDDADDDVDVLNEFMWL